MKKTTKLLGNKYTTPKVRVMSCDGAACPRGFMATGNNNVWMAVAWRGGS